MCRGSKKYAKRGCLRSLKRRGTGPGRRTLGKFQSLIINVTVHLYKENGAFWNRRNQIYTIELTETINVYDRWLIGFGYGWQQMARRYTRSKVLYLHCLNPRLGSRPMGVPRADMNLCSFCKKICSPLGRSPARYGAATLRIPFFSGESLLCSNTHKLLSS